MSVNPTAFAVTVAVFLHIATPMACFVMGDDRKVRQILLVDDYSALAWYLLADPADTPAFGVCYLHGQERPVIEDAPLFPTQAWRLKQGRGGRRLTGEVPLLLLRPRTSSEIHAVGEREVRIFKRFRCRINFCPTAAIRSCIPL